MQPPPASPQGAERFIRKSAGIALWGYTLLIFIMLLPAIALKTNPDGFEPTQEAQIGRAHV